MPRPSVAVAIRASFETATRVGSLALKRIVDAWRTRGLEITDLYGPDAIRTKVLESLSTRDPVLVFGCGHGNSDLWTGQDYDQIFWSCNSLELRDRIVVALSCVTAAGLGPDAVNNKGARCYIGWDETFTWIMEQEQDPLVDPKARGFFEAVLEILYRLTDGASTSEAFRASMDVWNYWINFWTRSTDPDAPLVLQHMIHDRDHQKLIGDQMATVTLGIPAAWWPVSAIMGIAPLVVIAAVVAAEEGRKAGILL